jgi:hypothetical protein
MATIEQTLVALDIHSLIAAPIFSVSIVNRVSLAHHLESPYFHRVVPATLRVHLQKHPVVFNETSTMR